MNRTTRIPPADKRYSVTPGFVTAARPMFFAWFCGTYIGQGRSKAEAQTLCVLHKAARECAA